MSARRPWAWPLVPLYAAGLRAKDELRGQPQKLAWPVVSVGSLSAGGAGKTPVVIALAELLCASGWGVDVLSRGYGRSTEGVERVLTELPNAAARFGDEPVLIAERAHLPVWVGSSRFDAGNAAESTWNGVERRSARAERRHEPRAASAAEPQRSLHLLDDGFQHRELARDVDIVLVTADDLNDALLPAGNRREPWSALARAHAVVVRMDERERVVPFVREHLRPEAKVWVIRRALHFPAPLGVLSAGLRPMAFCAIARPENFADMIKSTGCGLVDTLFFPDHHAYAPRDIDEILRTAEQLKASGFITTEKDAVKLTGEMRARLEQFGPLVVPPLAVEFAAPGEVLGDLAAVLG